VLVKKFSSPLILLIALLLTACGYHLRGEIDLPTELKSIYIEGASPQLQIVDTRAAAGTIIVISNEETSRRALSLGAGGKANQFGLEYRLNYDITDKEGKPIAKSQPVEIIREYFNDQQLILGKDNEEIVIRNEMYQQAVRTMINQIRFGLKPKGK
jgi:LPS-assembly lipoprotein